MLSIYKLERNEGGAIHPTTHRPPRNNYGKIAYCVVVFVQKPAIVVVVGGAAQFIWPWGVNSSLFSTFNYLDAQFSDCLSATAITQQRLRIIDPKEHSSKHRCVCYVSSTWRATPTTTTAAGLILDLLWHDRGA